MFKASKAKTVKAYLASVPEDRRKIIAFLHDFIRKAAPGLKPYFASNMLGYGKFPYKNHKGETVDWPVVALADQKRYVSIYICAVIDGRYVAERFKKDLGKVSVGKSCIRFRKLEDVHLPTLRKAIVLAAKHPGLVGAGDHT